MPRRTVDLRPDEIAAVLGSAVVRTADLVALGLRRSTISRRCAPGGPWLRLAPGLVLLRNGPPTRDDRRHAALRHGGPGALLTGLDALLLAGMRRVPPPSGPVHLLVPIDRRRTGHGLALVERTDRLPERTPGRWPLAPVERAVLDYTRRCTDRDQVRSALAETVQRGFATPAGLAAELAAGSRRGRALPREALEEVGDGIRSVAEAKARELVLGSRLPRPVWNPRLLDVTGRFLACPDAWFDEAGLAWEIDSREWHLSPADYDRTLDRRSAMMAAGVVVVHTQPSRITREGPAVLRELECNLAQARLRPRPVVLALPPDAPNGTFGR